MPHPLSYYLSLNARSRANALTALAVLQERSRANEEARRTLERLQAGGTRSDLVHHS